MLLNGQRNRRAVLLMLLVGSLLPGAWITRNWLVIGQATLSTQTEGFYFGNNAWARGSFNGDFFTMGKEAPQMRYIAERHPGFWHMSEVERSDAWRKEAFRSITSAPSRFLWLLYRKTVVFWAPLQYWSHAWYPWHLAYAAVMPFAAIGAFVGWYRQRYDTLAIGLPVLAVFLAVLTTYALDKYRFVSEPYLALLGAVGFLSTCTWLSQRHSRTASQIAAGSGSS